MGKAARLIFVPIEPLPERYSEQWLQWFKQSFKALNIDYIQVGDEKPRKIKTGQFLDVYDTNVYKLNQMKKIIKLIEKGFEGTIFFMDLWFPSLEVLAYIRSNAKRKIRIEGMLHAGTWDRHDFLTQNGCTPWARPFETSMLEIADKIYVATRYHKRIILRDQPRAYEKIEIVRFPCFTDHVRRNAVKRNIVVFPHRIAPEKAPEIFEMIKELYQKMFKKDKVWFLRTKDKCHNKEEYYNLLGSCKVAFSSAYQETFGIAMLEALNLGCLPVAPNRLSYRETLKGWKLYNHLDEACKMIHEYIKNYDRHAKRFRLKYTENVDNIVGRITL